MEYPLMLPANMAKAEQKALMVELISTIRVVNQG